MDKARERAKDKEGEKERKSERVFNWFCFYYFARNSLVALLEAVCRHKPRQTHRHTHCETHTPCQTHAHTLSVRDGRHCTRLALYTCPVVSLCLLHLVLTHSFLTQMRCPYFFPAVVLASCLDLLYTITLHSCPRGQTESVRTSQVCFPRARGGEDFTPKLLRTHWTTRCTCCRARCFEQSETAQCSHNFSQSQSEFSPIHVRSIVTQHFLIGWRVITRERKNNLDQSLPWKRLKNRLYFYMYCLMIRMFVESDLTQLGSQWVVFITAFYIVFILLFSLFFLSFFPFPSSKTTNLFQINYEKRQKNNRGAALHTLSLQGCAPPQVLNV